MLNRLLILIIGPLFLASCVAPAAQTPLQQHGRLSVGGVSAADPRAAAAGMEILREGGNAADAAMAVLIALTVVEPQSSGIGGGGFLLYHSADEGGRIATYDGRETAPAAATPDYFLVDGRPQPFGEAVPGGKSVGVPGNFRMMAMAHARHGKLPWGTLFQPAIRLARQGYALSPRMNRFLTQRAELAGSTEWAQRTFFEAPGRPKPVGSIITNPELAAFLEEIARLGADHFYAGRPAEALVRTVRTSQRNPAMMTRDDLASYDAKEREALCGSYRGHRICGMGPPSSGATAVFAILKQLERFDLASLGPADPLAWHLIAESMRLAYADREAYIADPDYVAVPAAGLMNPAYLQARSLMISPDRALPRVAPGAPPGAAPRTAVASAEVPSTSHFVVVDGAGNVASLTSTIEGAWGSGLTVDGYYLNNELTDFSFAPESNGAPVANRVEGGKRPRSSMSPTIVYGPDGTVRIAIGAAGGATIIAQVAKALIGVIDWKLGAQEALALPQIMGVGNRVTVERGTMLEAMIPALNALGHNVQPSEFPLKANALEQTGGRWRGAADPRSEGVALIE
jgi:gamma-glutamyltranspeptidase / glutathione hydrolase